MQVGDLIKWTDYTEGKPISYIGMLVSIDRGCQTDLWGDISVMTGKGIEVWVSWQCEIINKATRKKENAAFEENKVALKVLSEVDFLVRQDSQNNSKGDIKILRFALKQYIKTRRSRLTGEDFNV